MGTTVTDLYGANAFSDVVMRERLPKAVYKEIKAVQKGEKVLSPEAANVVAAAMKDWAIERGATHYTHWFQPLTGATAEKHDSFIEPTGDGRVLMEFSGKALIQGEPDASSFPSGGLRDTFEARGYTAWDTTSPAFIKDEAVGKTLAIPTAFIGYHGEALDKKTPLLRSMDALNVQALRVLKALGNTTATKVTTTVGPEQEYFLIDKEYFEKRPDLLLSGRTVFGAMPSKGQELDDHYFGAIQDRVSAYMNELNAELWKLGIDAKTQHNEVAPNQFELATIFNTSNVAADSNQLVMETMKKVAKRHDLVCLLHEKPFAGVNGSGKHNNWSMGTDDGQNLLEPGDTPHENAQFLLFASAVIKAVDVYAPLLRMSAGNSGNDHRLGANEAPPAIISIFLGDLLAEIFEAIAKDKKVEAKEGGSLQLGANCLPDLPRDLTDRNRTSPFAFTGNKFEFRMCPSSDSISGPNVVLNTAVAEILSEVADRLEKSSNVTAEMTAIIKDFYNTHERVVFNGNGYSDEWVAEAEKRGLPNLKATVYTLPEVTKDYSVELFTKHKVFIKEELESRVNIYSEKYAKQINIEASVMVEMAKLQIAPAAMEYASELANQIASIKEIVSVGSSATEGLVKAIAENVEALLKETAVLEEKIEAAHAKEEEGEYAMALAFREDVFTQMDKVRAPGDALEKLVAKEYWPFPTYEDMLFKL